MRCLMWRDGKEVDAEEGAVHHFLVGFAVLDGDLRGCYGVGDEFDAASDLAAEVEDDVGRLLCRQLCCG